MFETAAQLTLDDNDQVGDVYLYDAKAHELVRISAPPDGGTSAFGCDSTAKCNGELGAAPRGWIDSGRLGVHGAQHQNVVENPSGTVSVFFETRVAMVPEDTNGSRMDVYEWQAGVLRLVSPGDSADDSYFSGNSTDGRDVFMYTSKRIDPREIDDDYDIYDARVGGGFPYTPPDP